MEAGAAGDPQKKPVEELVDEQTFPDVAECEGERFHLRELISNDSVGSVYGLDVVPLLDGAPATVRIKPRGKNQGEDVVGSEKGEAVAEDEDDMLNDDNNTYASFEVLYGMKKCIRRARFAAVDEAWLASCDYNSSSSSKRFGSIPVGQGSYAVAHLQDFRHILVGQDDGHLSLHSLYASVYDDSSDDSPATVRTWNAHTSTLRSVAVDPTCADACVDSCALSPPSQAKFVTGGWDACCKHWDLTREEPLSTLHSGSDVNNITYLRDGNSALVCCDGSLAFIWDLRSGERVRDFVGHTGWVWCGAQSIDETTIVTGGNDGTIRICDFGTGKERSCLKQQGSVTSMIMHPDGTVLAGNDKKLIRQINLEREVCTNEYAGQTPKAIRFTPDFTHLISVGEDGFVRTAEIASTFGMTKSARKQR